MKKLILTTFILTFGSVQAMEIQQTSSSTTQQGIVLNRAVKVKYKNYRGEVGIRTIIPMEVYWGQTEYHPHDQWLLKVWDVEKNAERIYAFKDIQEFDCK
jgi:hypothetical protein